MHHIPLPSRADEGEFGKLVEFARGKALDPATVARLAERLADSGERLNWPSTIKTADLASTGGPGSLSTLVPPFVLNALGWTIVKLGVPGRPAGAIDSLGTLPGYKVTLTSDEVRAAVTGCAFAHFLADERFAPLDAALFAYRRRAGAVAVPLLVAGSLLAKKIAVGVRALGLDVRVGSHGNFGTTLEAARLNARAFCAAARILGIEAVAFISTDEGPMQPLIGRGEALVALARAAGLHRLPASNWLAGHIRQCHLMADTVATIDEVQNTKVAAPYSDDQRRASLRSALERHLVSQGSSIDALVARVSEVVDSPRVTLCARERGVLKIDLAIIRDVLVRLQADSPNASFSDPAGIELLVRPGQEVNVGDELARVRSVNLLALDSLAIDLLPAFSVRSRHVGTASLGESELMEVVRG